jgi:RNA polymerase sigma-54 factor
VAAALGLHPSTVSRCVAGKALRCPNGDVVALADLLGGAVALKARLAELATANRWSDTRLVQALADSGHRVARRTVAKYRAELGIAAGGLRRI